MKLAIFSDFHLHTWKSFGTSDDKVISKRLQDQINILEQIYEIIQQNDIKFLIFAGDLFHKRGEIPVECLNIITEWLYRIEKICMVIMVRGNHDLYNDRHYHKLNDALNFLEHNKKSGYEIERIGDLTIKTVGYCDEVDYEKIKNYDLVIVHKQPEITNEYGHHFTGVNWKKLASQNKLVFFGHYHKRNRLSDNCFIIGSPLALTFDDKNDRGIWIVDTTGLESTLSYDFEVINNLAVAFVPLKYPKFITVNEESEVVHGDGNYYRVLNATTKSTDVNVVNVIKPEFFEERIKSNDFNDVLREWLTLHQKDDTALEVIKDVVTDKVQSVKRLFDGVVTKVAIKDFLSIGEIELNVENGFTLITGLNLDTNDSNGSGKTGIFESIYWCLFGETTKGLTGDDVIRRGVKNCKVTLNLVGKEAAFVVSRSRKEGLIVDQIKEGEHTELVEGLKQIDRQAFLEQQILGFDKNIFLASCYFSQENLVMLTGLSDVEKTSMLTKLLGFDTYDDLYLKTFAKIKLFQTDIFNIENEKHDLNSQINNNQAKIDVLNRTIKSFEDDIKRYENEASRYKQQIEQIASTEEIPPIVVDYDAKLDEVNTKIEKLEGEIYSCDTDIEVATTNNADDSKDYFRFSSERNSLTDQVNRLNRQMIKFHDAKAGVRCEICGSLVTAENLHKCIEEKRQEIEQTNVILSGINEQYSKAEELKNVGESAIRDLKAKKSNKENNLRVLKTELRSITAEKRTYDEKVSQYERRKDTIKHEIEKLEVSIKSMISLIPDTNKKIEDNVKQRDVCNDVILDIDDKIKKIDWRIDKLNKGIEVLEFWKMSFSPNGIRALLLDRFCNQFNSLVNDYLSTVSAGTMSIAVSPTKTLKSGEERNRIGLDIYTNGTMVKYESLSGGEKRRIDMSLCLTLNHWVSMTYQLSHGLLGILILDELFAFVDHLGEESIATLLYEEGQDKAVYVVSHTADLSSYGENRLTVIKEKGVTHL